jgi:hypothetical protein
MLLPDGDELGAKPETNDGDVELFAHVWSTRTVRGHNLCVIASMPAVLSDLEGVKEVVFTDHAAEGGSHAVKSVERFE